MLLIGGVASVADTASYLAGDRKTDYLLTIKGNRPSLYAAAIAAGREALAGEPEDVVRERGHGRINRWTTWTTGIDPTVWEYLGLPYATRLAVIRRDVADLAGQPLSKEIVTRHPTHHITSRPAIPLACALSW